jgi:hypothetical protein
MRRGCHFEIDIELAGEAPSMHLADSEVSALEAVRVALNRGAAVALACLGIGVDYGNLILTSDSDGLVHIRALEHQGFCTARPVTINEALAVVEYWLPKQERTPALQWEAE